MSIHGAKLILEDGTVFEGQSFGAPKSQAGEVVFATGMVGYDLSLTDPSYAGQILTFTYPLIGNWGVPPKDFWESDKIHVAGLIISDLTTHPSHWQSQKTLDAWLKEEGIPGIYGIDTRALTQKLREKGVMLGKIVVDNKDVALFNPNEQNLVAQVSANAVEIHHPFQGDSLKGTKIGLINCGTKQNIIRSLVNRGATVYELPWNYDPFENNLPIDGLVISNGPGDPKMADKSIAIIKKTLELKIPTFGICLGNQLLALAAGGDTYKLKFGHRAQNQPTIMVDTKRCYITTQNHGFAVVREELEKHPDFEITHEHINDGTVAGMRMKSKNCFSVQYHPEASPGPHDASYLFDQFITNIEKSKMEVN